MYTCLHTYAVMYIHFTNIHSYVHTGTHIIICILTQMHMYIYVAATYVVMII